MLETVCGEITVGVRLEGLGDHHGAEIGSTDVDDGSDGFSGVARPGAGSDGVIELAHVSEDGDVCDTRFVGVESEGGGGGAGVAEGDGGRRGPRWC
jgi:hypothetical protein